jgi:hypothetical protein
VTQEKVYAKEVISMSRSQTTTISEEVELKKEEQPTEENVLEALRQNWLHARHLETERLWFTNIYGVIVAGTLAFLGQYGINNHRHLMVFLFMLSLFGLLVVLKTSHEFGNHMRAIENSIETLHLSKHLGFPTAYSKGKLIWRLIRVRYAFVGFYLATMVLLLYLWIKF